MSPVSAKTHGNSFVTHCLLEVQFSLLDASSLWKLSGDASDTTSLAFTFVPSHSPSEILLFRNKTVEDSE
jgi:hypothetical protein